MPPPIPRMVSARHNGLIDYGGGPIGYGGVGGWGGLHQIDPRTGKLVGPVPGCCLGAELWDADWSPDGSHLVTAMGCAAACDYIGAFTLDVATGQTRQLTHEPTTGVTAVAWSPDGTKIAYVQVGQIYVTDPKGSRVGFVQMAGHTARSVSWSPDSTQIVFADADGRGNVYVVGLNGSAPRLVVRGAEPAWSPDGTRIAFRRDCTLWVTSVNGSRTTQIADLGSPQFLALDPAHLKENCVRGWGGPQGQPEWSSDGRLLAVALPRWGVAVLRPDGSNLRVLQPFERRHPRVSGFSKPAWQPVP
jgi:Tol biopolymer transport system component